MKINKTFIQKIPYTPTGFYILTVLTLLAATTVLFVWVNRPAAAYSASDFVIQVKTDNPGVTSNLQFQIPTTGSGYNYAVDCDDDGIVDLSGLTGDATCDYPVAGTYTIAISGTFPQIYFNNGGDKLKIINIKQWGAITWQSMTRAFSGAANLTSDATDTPDLSQATSMNGAFKNATSFNADISGWDTSTIVDMSGTFQGATAFNADISGWNTGAVVNMSSMFRDATSFNADISGWDTSSLQFAGSMLRNATSFDQNIGGWDMSQVVDLTGMFQGNSISVGNYDATLSGWASQPVQTAVSFSGGDSQYLQSASDRDYLVTQKGWVINDGGMYPVVSPTGVTPGSVIVDGTAHNIVIDGSNFKPGVVVKFGNTTVDVTGQTATQLTVSVPTTGIVQDTTVDVTVTNPAIDGDTATLTDAFSYVTPTPHIDAVSPDVITADGTPHTVVITGSGFQPGETVTFGSITGHVIAQTPTQLTVQVPTFGVTTGGVVDIAVVSQSGKSDMLVGGLTFNPSLSPMVTAKIDGHDLTGSPTVLPQPTLSGIAPIGATVVVEVHSSGPVTCTTVADAEGNWSCTLPTGLEPGIHTVRITITTTTGTVRVLGPYDVVVSGTTELYGTLADTGTDIYYYAAGAILCIIMGTVLLGRQAQKLRQ